MKQVPWAALPALAALLSLAGPLAATDSHVDVVHGSDTNGGTSPADAWRTITHAFAVGGADRLLVAPGTYSASTGEVFPLGDAMQVVGLRGSAATVIDGEGASVTLFEGRFVHLRGGRRTSERTTSAPANHPRGALGTARTRPERSPARQGGSRASSARSSGFAQWPSRRPIHHPNAVLPHPHPRRHRLMTRI